MSEFVNNSRRAILFIYFFSMIIGLSRAQLPSLYSSAGFEYGKANAIDPQGNYLNTALFQNTIWISDQDSLTAQGLGTDIALTKYDPEGQLIWAKRMGGMSADGPHGVATDANGNIYLTGYFGSNLAIATSNFDPTGSPEGNVTAQGGEDAFLAKYDADGNFLWALGLGNIGETSQERAWDIAVDAQGNSYIGGGFWGTMDFNPLGEPNIQSLSNDNGGLFLAKYDPDGINQWAIVIDANITNVFAEGYITFDLNLQENKIFAAGNFRGSNIELDPLGIPSIVNSNGLADIFLAAYEVENSTLEWARTIGSPQQDLVAPGALRLDNLDNIWFTGRLSGNNSVDFDPGDGVSLVTNSSLFLSSFDADGNFLSATGMDSGIGDGGHRVGFDAQNNVYLAGWMSGTLNFGNGISKTAQSTTADVFLAKYSNAGICQWVSHFGGNNSPGNSICAGLVVDADGNSYITGQLYGEDANINPNGDTRLMSSIGSNDCFVIRYNSDGQLFESAISTSVKKNFEEINFSIYPNPAQHLLNFDFTDTQLRTKFISIFNLNGQLEIQKNTASSILQMDIQRLKAGSYTIIIQDVNAQILGTSSFIKI